MSSRQSWRQSPRQHPVPRSPLPRVTVTETRASPSSKNLLTRVLSVKHASCVLQRWMCLLNPARGGSVLLVHVSERRRNNSVMQRLAGAGSRAHVSRIRVQTCGCSLGSMGESVSHTVRAAKFWEPCGGRLSTSSGECPYLTLGCLLYNSPAGNPGHCAALAPLSEYAIND